MDIDGEDDLQDTFIWRHVCMKMDLSNMCYNIRLKFYGISADVEQILEVCQPTTRPVETSSTK